MGSVCFIYEDCVCDQIMVYVCFILEDCVWSNYDLAYIQAFSTLWYGIPHDFPLSKNLVPKIVHHLSIVYYENLYSFDLIKKAG